jgi:nucleoside-diphosphate-sugar epimerase
MPSAVVFGGSGQLGAAAARRLLSCGWDIWTVTREGRVPPASLADQGGRPPRLVDGTGRSRAQVIQDIGAPIDGVFDPTTYDAADAADLLRARGRFGALVVASSASVYAGSDGRSLVAASQAGGDWPTGPIAETADVVTAGDATYATRKVALEQMLLNSGLSVSVLRPCAVHGSYATHPREWWFMKRGLDGRRAVPVAYGARSVFHTSSAAGIADLASRCLEASGARVLNVADDDAPSVMEIARTIGEVTDLDIQIAPFEGPPVGPSHVGSTPWSAERPFVLDTAAARGLGWTGGRYADNVGETCHWILDVARSGDWKRQFSMFSKYGYDPFDYAAEDELLARM